MSDSPESSAALERLMESNARLSKMLELAHAENRMLEKEIQLSKIKISGLQAGINFSATNQQASSAQVVGTILQAMISEHGTEDA
jgi:hypothetical protein